MTNTLITPHSGLRTAFAGQYILGSSDGKESGCNAGDPGLIPGSGRSPGEGTGYPLKCSGLESSMDRGAWQATVHGIAKSRSQVSNFHMHSSGSHRELAKNPRTSDQRGTEGKPKGGDLQKPRGTSFPRRA